MERLTEWNDEQTRHAYYPRCFEEPCYGGGCKIKDCPFETAVCDRLAAYEDTGLTPERCAEFARADAEGRYIVMRDAEQEGVARLRELAEADADVAPVRHGRWEWLGPNRLVTDCMCGTCSACKVRSKYIVNTMLCPNCGAKMDGGDSDASL